LESNSILVVDTSSFREDNHWIWPSPRTHDMVLQPNKKKRDVSINMGDRVLLLSKMKMFLFSRTYLCERDFRSSGLERSNVIEFK
jgi:hypothetical protein